MTAAPSSLGPLLRTATWRLALRGIARGASAGAWVGVAIGACAVGLRLGGVVPWPVAAGLFAVGAAGAIGVGAGIGLWRHSLTRRELALLVDRAVGSDESLVTALHQLEATGATDALRTVRATPADVSRAIPIAAPAHGRIALAVLVVAAVGLWFTPRMGGAPLLGPDDNPVIAEAQLLEERLQSEEAALLPEELRQQAAEVVESLTDETLTPEEAADRLKSLQETMQAFKEQLEPSKNLLEELEEAAKELDADAMDRLSDALAEGNMGQAGEAANDLAEAMSQASPEEQKEAAQQLKAAGEQLSQSSDPSLQAAGEAMKQAGESMEAGGNEGQPLSGQQAESLRDALEQNKELGDKLQQDKKRLEQIQQLEGATQGAQDRLDPQEGSGGEGEGQEQQVAQQGQGQGEGEGEGEGGEPLEVVDGAGGGGAGAGDGHTWEDEGEFDIPNGGNGASSKAPEGDDKSEVIDDFEKFYAAVRLPDTQTVLASEQGELVDGKVDVLLTRLGGSDETATTKSVDMPASYRQEAVEAIETETIPPAYREAVKTYFDH